MQRNHHASLALATMAAMWAVTSTCALAAADLSGQWVGNSGIDGSRAVSKTTLVLGTTDAQDSSLRLEDRSVCMLRQGKYSVDANGALSLSFGQASGSEACERLGRGTFIVREGASPRALQFEATYPGPDGGQNVRRGALARYP